MLQWGRKGRGSKGAGLGVGLLALLALSSTPGRAVAAFNQRESTEAQGRIRACVVSRTTRAPLLAFTVSWRPTGRAGSDERGASSSRGRETPFQSADGRFHLGGLDPGRIDLTLRAPGYRPRVVTGVEIAGEPVSRSQPELVIELERGVRLLGRVIDEGRRPIRGAEVRARLSQEEGAQASVEAGEDADATVTDAQGLFVFDALAPGPTTLQADAKGHAPAMRRLVVGEHDAPAEIVLRARVRLTGTVRRRHGGPVKDAEVVLEPMRVAAPRSRRRISGPDGRFAFSGLDQGVYRLRVASPAGAAAERVVTVANGHSPHVLVEIVGLTIYGRILGLTAEESGTVSLFGRTRKGRVEASVDPEGGFVLVDLPPGDITLFASLATTVGTRSVTKSLPLTEDEPEVRVELAFPAGSALAGLVTRAGEPLSGRPLILRREGDAPGSGATTTSDASGSYFFDGLADGRYQLSLSASDAATVEQEVDVQGWTQHDIEIPTTRLTGRVVGSPTGEPIGGAAVRLIGPADRGDVRAFRTEVDGRFVFDNLSPGEYAVMAEAEAWAPGRTRAVVQSEGDSTEVDVALERDASLSLRVIDRRTETPASSLNVMVLQGGSLISRTSLRGAGGVFRVPGLQPGRADLVALAPDAAPTTLLGVTIPGAADVQVSTGGTIRILSPPAPGMARLFRPDGGVQWQAAGPNAFMTAMRVSAPETVLGPVEAGLYRLLITFGAETRGYEVVVHDGETTTLSAAE